METATAPLVDVLLLTALTEEQQVVEQVLQLRASYRGQAGEPPERVNVYAYPPGAHRPYHVATASIHQMGAVPMAAKAPRIFNAVRPETAVLLGISATTVPGAIDLGDVPVASQVIEYDDIAAAPGEFIFRPDGYQVDPRLRDAAGALRADLARYSVWQDDCLAVIADLVTRLNGARSTQISAPSDVRRPHLLVGIGAGGPFLIRDPDFRSKVQSLHPKLTWVEMESHGFMRAAAGRLVVLPAPLVGCSQTAVGWTDDLLLRLLGGVVNVVSRADAAPATQILDLTTTTIPFLDGVPLDVLPAVLDETEEWIPDLRNVVFAGRRSERPEETWRTTISMEGALRGAFRQLSERFQKLASRSGGREWRVAHVDGALAAGRADVLGQTEEPVTALLRSVVSEKTTLAPWIPYWRLTGIGGRLSWSSPLDNPSARPLSTISGPHDMLYGEVQSWLCKGNTTGLLVPVVRTGPVYDH